MEKKRENWYDKWESGMYGLAIDDLTSFYTYFTLVFSEIIVLWVHYQAIALPFTILLSVSLVNILATSFLKGRFEGTKLELVFTILFWAILGGAFISGFFFNVAANLILFAIPIAYSAMSITIRIFQNSKVKSEIKFITVLSNLFGNPLFWLITQLVVLVVPYWVLVSSILMLPIDSFYIKLAICVVYGMLMPYFAYIEDEWGAQNIFELGFTVVWSKDLDEAVEVLNKKFAEDPEGTAAEIQEFIQACMKEYEAEKE